MPRTKSSESRVYFSILFICYLEVLLWTACIFTGSFALTEDLECATAYCVRETNNLKELHGFESQLERHKQSPPQLLLRQFDQSLRHVSLALKDELRSHIELQERVLELQEQAEPHSVSFRQRILLGPVHLGIPSPPSGKKKRSLLV